MKPIIRNEEVNSQQFENCHEGAGVLLCQSMLDHTESEKFSLFHCDEMPAGFSIGEHTHKENEEIYYLVSGSGTLIYDGVEYEMGAGDISLCNAGHSHGFLAQTDSVLIVVGNK